ncbi:MAG: hypothetical protein WCF53_12505, partial [Pseudolabrys sp.]
PNIARNFAARACGFLKSISQLACQEMRAEFFLGGRELHEIAHHWRSVGNFDRLLPHSAAGIAGALHVERLYSQNREQSVG